MRQILLSRCNFREALGIRLLFLANHQTSMQPLDHNLVDRWIVLSYLDFGSKFVEIWKHVI